MQLHFCLMRRFEEDFMTFLTVWPQSESREFAHASRKSHDSSSQALSFKSQKRFAVYVP